MSQVDMKHEIGLADNNVTIVDWCNFCRDICAQWLAHNDNVTEIGGLRDDGTPIVVEIDESYFFHLKYHRGQYRRGHWVFGVVERESGKCFLVEVADRRRETLENLIRRYILPGSHIVSDGWAAYAHIPQRYLCAQCDRPPGKLRG